LRDSLKIMSDLGFEPGSIDSRQEWQSALEKAREYGICGLALGNDCQDPMSGSINLASLTLPDKTVYIFDFDDPARGDAGEMCRLACRPF